MEIMRKWRAIGRRIPRRVAVVIIIRKITVLLDIETSSLGMRSAAIRSPPNYLRQSLGILSSYYPRTHRRELVDGWKEEEFMSVPTGTPYLIYRSWRRPISLLALSGNCDEMRWRKRYLTPYGARPSIHPSVRLFKRTNERQTKCSIRHKSTQWGTDAGRAQNVPWRSLTL